MFDNTKKNSSGCFSEEEFVSYLYGEIRESDRRKFDVHLAGCSFCTEEFASVSESRFSVYEWQRSAFAGLETPEIAGPWQQPAVREMEAHGAVITVSWIDRLRAAAFDRPSFALATAVVALLVLVLGVGFLTLRRNSNEQVDVADKDANVAPAEDPSQTANLVVEHGNDKVVSDSGKEVKTPYAPSAHNTVKEPEVIKASENKAIPPKIRAERASIMRKRNLAPVNRRAPRLSDFDEEDDNTVRLSDLLADADTDK
jgi:hypothetical protein